MHSRTFRWRDVSLLYLLSLCLWLEPRAHLLPSVLPPVQAPQIPTPLTWETEKKQSWRKPHGPISLPGVPSKPKSQQESRCLQQSVAHLPSPLSSFLCVSVSSTSFLITKLLPNLKPYIEKMGGGKRDTLENGLRKIC